MPGVFPSAGVNGWSVFLVVVAAIFLFYSLNDRTLAIRVTADALRLRFGLIEWSIHLQDIGICHKDPVSLRRIGGAGIHLTSTDRRYRDMSSSLEYPRPVVGLKVKRGPVRDVIFSTRKPAEVMALVRPAPAGAPEENRQEA